MEIRSVIKIIPTFIECDMELLLQKANDVEYTGFYLPHGNTNQYFFKIGNNYYIVKSNNYESIEKMLVNKINSNRLNNLRGINIVHNSIGHCTMGITDLMNLYNYDTGVKVSDYFFINGTSQIFGNYDDFLQLVGNILQIEREITLNNIDRSNKYAVMKFIYDKYKMESSYWDPVGNYGTIRDANLRLLNDPNRLLRHPHDYLGLINDLYATCQGMAEGLTELYRYFGVDACVATSDTHGMCKVNLRDKSGQRHVSYIDLSREVTEGFQDNKHEYINGRPIPRRISNRIAQPNSYKFFMKARVGEFINDGDLGIAVDFRPQIRIIDEEPNLTTRRRPMRIINEEPDLVLQHRTK